LGLWRRRQRADRRFWTQFRLATGLRRRIGRPERDGRTVGTSAARCELNDVAGQADILPVAKFARLWLAMVRLMLPFVTVPEKSQTFDVSNFAHDLFADLLPRETMTSSDSFTCQEQTSNQLSEYPVTFLYSQCPLRSRRHTSPQTSRPVIDRLGTSTRQRCQASGRVCPRPAPTTESILLLFVMIGPS